MNDDARPTVQTTQTSIEILNVVRRRDSARLTEIADAVGLAKSTAYKHLVTLEQNGFLRRDGNAYRIGLGLLTYGEHVRHHWPGFEEATEAVTELTERTQEEVDFVVEDGGRVTTLVESYHPWVKYDDSVDTDSSASYRARVGDSYGMHSTAAGLAILAEYSEERVERILDRRGLPRRTEHTITDRATLFEALERIREDGYAVNDQGYTEGMRSLGKAVCGPDGTVAGALSVAGPTYRIDGAVLEEHLPRALEETARSLEAALAERSRPSR
ncbi:IclR family transcriptional regulator [Halobellus sp. Atlit-38R]|jgi:DNA-binding IclR family transcriptional regulator|uniref:IclR family transcriptional regulator n=1 Tax=Halobellus sp. Atlit-38R TaxID=2282131 RepID=UPI000EF1EE9D|nr:IclR family transcriptional regulator [Halobellus sp. Atlit-38R]RLM90401.1 IclR family transcriptional regulator [Halobellus sp. Atlit-38R]